MNRTNDLISVEHRLERHLRQIGNDIGRAQRAIEHRIGLLESEVNHGRTMLSYDIKSTKEALHRLPHGSIQEETTSTSFARKAIVPSPRDGAIEQIERIYKWHSISMSIGLVIWCAYICAILLICQRT